MERKLDNFSSTGNLKQLMYGYSLQRAAAFSLIDSSWDKLRFRNWPNYSREVSSEQYMIGLNNICLKTRMLGIYSPISCSDIQFSERISALDGFKEAVADDNGRWQIL